MKISHTLDKLSPFREKDGNDYKCAVTLMDYLGKLKMYVFTYGHTLRRVCWICILSRS